MIEELLELGKNSYSPYSQFRVAAIVVMKDGNKFRGVNVENASYGATICAERSGILSAVSAGYKKGDFKELHIMCLDSNKISTPCFMCRQVISELFDKDAIVTCYNNNGESKEYKVSELCPYPFDEDDLK
ncbi:MAG: cytidine deaminase [Bacilli bacterium]